MKETLIQHWRELLPLAAAVTLAVGAGFYWLRPQPEDPTELERARRAHVNRVGRIVEGHILEIAEHHSETAASRVSAPPAKRKMDPNINDADPKLLYYTYSISGVTYETAQDISGMQEAVILEKVVAGQSASVKYDPSNPSNSILVSDDWSGLH